MKLKTIYDQIVTYLPLHTNLFNDVLTINSLTYSSGVVTAVTSIAHGLITGDIANIKGALERNSISSLVSFGGIATAVTVNNHDLTKNFQKTVNISGADQSEYNGIKTLLKIIDEKTFAFQVTGTPVSPATGPIFLNENKAFGYNGLFNITVVNPITFTYSVERDLDVFGGNPKASLNPRIFTGIDIARIITTYTEKPPDNYVLFIVLGATSASRNKNIQSDATYEYIRGQEYRQQSISNINLYVFAPTSKTVNAGIVRDSFEDLRFFLIKILAGAFLNSGSSDTNRRAITYSNDNTEFYNGAFLVHHYTFETVFDITQDDIFQPLESAVIKDLKISYLNNFDEIIKKDDKEF